MVTLGNGVGHQAQHGRMHRVIKMSHRLVGPVNRQGVLNQVIGANRQKVKVLQKDLERERGCRDFNHGTYPDWPIWHTTVVKLYPGMVDQSHGLTNFTGMHQHRNK